MTGHDEQTASPALVVCPPRYLQSRHSGQMIVGNEYVCLVNGSQSFLRISKTPRRMPCRTQACGQHARQPGLIVQNNYTHCYSTFSSSHSYEVKKLPSNRWFYRFGLPSIMEGCQRPQNLSKLLGKTWQD